MNHSKVAVRYAKAFYESCAEQKILKDARDDMQLIAKTIADVPEFKALLENPIAKPSKKITALEAILTGKVAELTINFIKLVVNNKREAYLDAIARDFLHSYKVKNGIGAVVVTSAQELDTSVIEKLTSVVEKSMQIKAEVQTKIDPSLIGGYVLRIEDVQFDSSIATKLKHIKKSLLN